MFNKVKSENHLQDAKFLTATDHLKAMMDLEDLVEKLLSWVVALDAYIQMTKTLLAPSGQ